MSSVYHGTECLSFLGPKIWELVPSDIKQLESLEIFKRRIKKWVPFQCLCRLFQIYLLGVGFILKYTTIIRLFLELLLRVFLPFLRLLVSTLINIVNHYEVLVSYFLFFLSVVYMFYCILFVKNK